MKFLFLYKFDPSYHFDKYFHLDLVKHYTKAGYESMCYGPRVHEAYSEETVQEFDPNITLAQLHKKFPFDAVICLTKSRMFENYRPPLVPPPSDELRVGCWLPKDFATFETTRVMIDEDTHYETSNEWYHEMRFDVVFNRHYSNNIRFHEKETYGIKGFWLPFSVDPELFKSDGRQRINKFCMASSVVHEIYKWRKMQLEKLVPLGLMEDFKEQRKVGQDYIECLKSYVGHGCCSSIYDITPAKIFEITASGSVLFTDNTNKYGIEKLFDKEAYVTYQRNGSDMVEVAQTVLDNPKLVKLITSSARQNILNRHTHQIRIEEMIDILENQL